MALRPVGALLLVVVLTGCASGHHWPEPGTDSGKLPERVELSDTPFHAQERYQCGPASLAMMLNTRELPATPESLKERVYLPERGGTLQVEMVSAARERGLVAYPLEPELEALMRETAAGNPVLVMQNLGFDWWPQWHYAVVIGYDRLSDDVILHTDTRAAYAQPMSAFMNSWERADHWAMVLTPPDQLPATAQPLSWLGAVSDLESTGRLSAAEVGYRRALEAWPDQPAARFGLGNIAYQRDQYELALEHFFRLTRDHPDFEPAWHNLGVLLEEMGCSGGNKGSPFLPRAC